MRYFFTLSIYNFVNHQLNLKSFVPKVPGKEKKDEEKEPKDEEKKKKAKPKRNKDDSDEGK